MKTEEAWEKIIVWVENGDVDYADIIDMINSWHN